MSLKLMYITNNPEVAQIAEKSGVDRIFVDLEYIGKEQRQPGMDTVKSHHTFDDITAVKKVLKKAELLVRCNSIYSNTEDEIDEIIKRKADIIMLPYFKTVDEVKYFIDCVRGRAKTMLLVETPEAVERIDDILKIDGIDEMYIGLNDLSLGYEKKFMFELLADGTVEMLCKKFKMAGKPYGFGGIAAMGTGTLPAENILIEHHRLGSTCVILSRSFCNCEKITDDEDLKKIFQNGILDIRREESNISEVSFDENKHHVQECVNKILDSMKARA